MQQANLQLLQQKLPSPIRAPSIRDSVGQQQPGTPALASCVLHD